MREILKPSLHSDHDRLVTSAMGMGVHSKSTMAHAEGKAHFPFPFPNCLPAQLLHPIMCSGPLSMVCNPSFPSSTCCPKASYLLRNPRAGPRGSSECFFLPLPHSLPLTSPVLYCSHPGPLPTWNTPRLTSYTKSNGRRFPYSHHYVLSSWDVTITPAQRVPGKCSERQLTVRFTSAPEHPPHPHLSALLPSRIQ